MLQSWTFLFSCPFSVCGLPSLHGTYPTQTHHHKLTNITTIPTSPASCSSSVAISLIGKYILCATLSFHFFLTVLCVTTSTSSSRSYNKRDGRLMCVALSIGKPLYLVTKTVDYGMPPSVCENGRLWYAPFSMQK
jgi:hypothetical protein